MNEMPPFDPQSKDPQAEPGFINWRRAGAWMFAGCVLGVWLSDAHPIWMGLLGAAIWLVIDLIFQIANLHDPDEHDDDME